MTHVVDRCPADIQISQNQFWPIVPKKHSIAGWWFGTFFFGPYIGNVIIPTDFHMFQDG
jgi:hypothetical protein